jgi:hypothetical protein
MFLAGLARMNSLAFRNSETNYFKFWPLEKLLFSSDVFNLLYSWNSRFIIFLSLWRDGLSFPEHIFECKKEDDKKTPTISRWPAWV